MSSKFIGGVILAVLGWALASIGGELKDTEDSVMALEHRLSVLETEFRDHNDLVEH